MKSFLSQIQKMRDRELHGLCEAIDAELQRRMNIVQANSGDAGAQTAASEAEAASPLHARLAKLGHSSGPRRAA